VTLREKLLSDRAKLIEYRAAAGEQRALEGIDNGFQVKGVGRSGALVQARHDRRVSTVRDVLAERFKLEQEHPLAPEDATSWYDALVEDIRDAINRSRERLLSAAESDWNRDLGNNLPSDVRSRFDQDINQIKQEYLADARLLREERRLRHPGRAAGSTLMININHSQVAALNLGPVIGNIQGVISGLSAAGQRDLAEAIRALTEVIAAESSLQEVEKREAVELVSALGEEFARGAEQTRPGLLRTVAGRLAQIVSGIASAQGAYEAVKMAARVVGYELP
jgi:hypothetical protein